MGYQQASPNLLIRIGHQLWVVPAPTPILVDRAGGRPTRKRATDREHRQRNDTVQQGSEPNEFDESEDPEESIEETEIHDVLRNERRRRTIEHLRNESGTITLRELSEAIAAAESGESPPPRNLRESVYNSLHQTHLPKLDSLDVVSYDRDRKHIEIDGRARDVDLYMEVVTEYGITWAEYYRSLGVLALFAVVASEVGVPVLVDAGTLAVTSVFLALIGVSILYQLWTPRWRYLRLLS
jgi:hypothetical protein